jgi:hypothetical protein
MLTRDFSALHRTSPDAGRLTGSSKTSTFSLSVITIFSDFIDESLANYYQVMGWSDSWDFKIIGILEQIPKRTFY